MFFFLRTSNSQRNSNFNSIVLSLNNEIQSNEKYVWAYAKGNTRGQSIEPLYPSVPEAVLKDEKLYELLPITDAIRVGRTREKLAVEYLKIFKNCV